MANLNGNERASAANYDHQPALAHVVRQSALKYALELTSRLFVCLRHSDQGGPGFGVVHVFRSGANFVGAGPKQMDAVPILVLTHD